MALLTESWLLDTLGILTSLIAVLIAWTKWSYTYWSKKGILHKPPMFFVGNGADVFLQNDSFTEFVQKYYHYLKSNKVRHGGMYLLLSPIYFPLDPEIIKSVMQTDFNHFIDRGFYINEEADPLSAHLFNLEGQKWRKLRAKLTPTFTSGKMKMMFETLVKCGDQLLIEMDKKMEKGAIDIKDILIRFTTDIIGNCAFGIDCNSLKDPDNEFSKNGRLFFQDELWDNLKNFLTLIAPRLMKVFGTVVTKKSVTKFFMNVVKETVEYREENNIHRKDFMHLLLQLKNRGELVDDVDVIKGNSDKSVGKFTLNELAAQAFVFFLAGFETSSTTMTFCLYELASNPDVQEKLRKEVNEVLSKYDGKLCYEAIMEMHYMEMVINETLRKYPPLPALNRICTKDYKIPGTDIVLEEGTKVLIPVFGLHRDPDYYPDPEKFDPDRFNEANKRERHPFTFIPFGEGPRVCIGLRFGMMQTKVGLCVLLKNFKFTLSPKTNVPIKWDVKNFIVASESGIWLDYTKV